MDLQTYRKNKRKRLIIGWTIRIVFVLIAIFLILFLVKKINKQEEPNIEKIVVSKKTKIKKEKKAEKKNTEKEDNKEVTLKFTFTGDIILGKDKNAALVNTMPAKLEEVGGDYTYFLKNFKPLFDSDDATIVDFEGTITESNNYVDKEFNFKASKDYLNILTSSGVDAVTVANNHSHDYGEQGFNDTLAALSENKIETCGYDKIAYLELKKKKIALVGAYLLNEGSEDSKNQVLTCIAQARQSGADLVIVFAHWGIERAYVPDAWQMTMGHTMVNSGADLVVGCHPHVIQGSENYNGHYIAYSMGNFCFGGNRNPSDKDCYITEYEVKFKGNKVEGDNMTLVPVSVSSSANVNDYCPRILEGDEKARVQAKIDDSSNKINAVSSNY